MPTKECSTCADQEVRRQVVKLGDQRRPATASGTRRLWASLIYFSSQAPPFLRACRRRRASFWPVALSPSPPASDSGRSIGLMSLPQGGSLPSTSVQHRNGRFVVATTLVLSPLLMRRTTAPRSPGSPLCNRARPAPAGPDAPAGPAVDPAPAPRAPPATLGQRFHHPEEAHLLATLASCCSQPDSR